MTHEGKENLTMGYFSEENMNQVNNKMQFHPVVCIIIWPYVNLQRQRHRGSDICGDWLSEVASEVSDSI